MQCRICLQAVDEKNDPYALVHLDCLDGKVRGGVSYHRRDQERADIVRQLRIVCAEFGDNDWPDNLHLGDVIEKHLARNLRRRD